MKNFLRIILIILTVITGVLVLGLIYLRSIFTPALSQRATERDFVKNKDDIIIVANYLMNVGYNYVSIYDTSDGKTIYAGGYGHINIDELQVVNALITLFNNGYQTISKDQNSIQFQRSSTLDFGNGIVYSISGRKPQLQYLTKLEPLSESNWYYYEENVNESRQGQQS